MPLSKPTKRQHIHTREITCRGFKRDDGLWDIEGRLTDTKTYTFDNIDRDGVAAGEPIHDMLVRLTLDDGFVVQAAEASTESGPYSVCGEATAAFAKLVGHKVGPGWRKRVAAAMGGTLGCTHLRDLVMGPLAVTAFQTIYPMRAMRNERKAGEKPLLLETCHAFSLDSPIVERRWPEFFEASSAGASSTGDNAAPGDGRPAESKKAG